MIWGYPHVWKPPYGNQTWMVKATTWTNICGSVSYSDHPDIFGFVKNLNGKPMVNGKTNDVLENFPHIIPRSFCQRVFVYAPIYFEMIWYQFDVQKDDVWNLEPDLGCKTSQESLCFRFCCRSYCYL